MSKIQNIRPGHRVRVVSSSGTTTLTAVGMVKKIDHISGTKWDLWLNGYVTEFDEAEDTVETIKPTSRYIIRKVRSWVRDDPYLPLWNVVDRFDSHRIIIITASSFEAARQAFIRWTAVSP